MEWRFTLSVLPFLETRDIEKKINLGTILHWPPYGCSMASPIDAAWKMLKAHPEDQMFLPLGKTPEDDREWQTNVPMGTVNPIIRRLLQERADREREMGRNLAEEPTGEPPLPDLRIGHGEGRPIQNIPPSTSHSQEPHSFEQFPPRNSPQAHLNRGLPPEEL